MTAVLLAACGERSPVSPPPPPPPTAAECAVPGASPALAPPEPLDAHFAAAALEFQVPESLLKAIGYTETRWHMVTGTDELGRAPAHGVMGLRGEALRRAAALAGVPETEAATRPAANIRAAAALLRAYADEAGLRSPDLAAWAPVAVRFSGIETPAARESYLRDGVFAVLRRGAVSPVASLRAVAPAALPTLHASTAASAPDYAGAVWRPSPNHNARPAGDIGRVAMVVIHTCEGGYAGCWGWLANPQSQVSAHYVVNEEGTEITQLVHESDRAWHIGARYRCALNVELDCWRNEQSSNHFTIGVEHAGYASQASFAAGQLDASARLVCDIARRQGITRDNLHVVAHGQLQPENRTDPGPNWPWADYLARIDHHCGGRSAGAALTVDDDQRWNDQARGYFRAPAGWTRASATRGFYGASYHFASADPAADGATFYIHNAASATRTVAAWWTAGTNRSPRTPFVVLGPDGRELGRATADQKTGGSRWNTLGSWSFPAGWSRIVVSRAAGAGCVAIADAVVVN